MVTRPLCPEPLWILLTLMPTIENRGGIPAAVLCGVDPLVAWIVSSLLSAIGGFAAYFLLEEIEKLVRVTPLRWIYDKYVERVRKKGERFVRDYGVFALPLLVAVPLPGSGAYTGALVAYLLGFPWRTTLLGLVTGTLLAGLVVLSLLGLAQGF